LRYNRTIERKNIQREMISGCVHFLVTINSQLITNHLQLKNSIFVFKNVVMATGEKKHITKDKKKAPKNVSISKGAISKNKITDRDRKQAIKEITESVEKNFIIKYLKDWLK